MTTSEIRERARKWRNCGLQRDADLLIATANLLDVIDAGGQVTVARSVIADMSNDSPT